MSDACHLVASCPAVQVGTVGEDQAAEYLYRQVQQIAEQVKASRPDLTAEAVRESVREQSLPGAHPVHLLVAAAAVGGGVTHHPAPLAAATAPHALL